MTTPKQTLTNETAEKVLLADLANILKKAQSGKPLTKYERDLVAEHADTPAPAPAAPVATHETEAALQGSYDSIAAAAAALGCTVARLRKAKKEGAPGFRGSRVYPAELVPWLKAREEMTGTDSSDPIDREGWEIRRLRLQCERLAFETDRDKGKMWDSNDVKAHWLQHMRAARQTWLQIAGDLAPRLAGRSAAECEALMRTAVDSGLEKLRGNPYGDAPFKCPHCGESIEFEGKGNEHRNTKEGGKPVQNGAEGTKTDASTADGERPTAAQTASPKRKAPPRAAAGGKGATRGREARGKAKAKPRKKAVG